MLVERNPEPNGIPLVNSKRVATKGFQEMMELEEDHLLVRQIIFLNNLLSAIF